MDTLWMTVSFFAYLIGRFFRMVLLFASLVTMSAGLFLPAYVFVCSVMQGRWGLLWSHTGESALVGLLLTGLGYSMFRVFASTAGRRYEGSDVYFDPCVTSSSYCGQ